MSEQAIQRRFSLEDDFMQFKTNDLLYAFMRYLSTARPLYEKGKPTGQYKEYLPVKEFVKNKKLIAGICGCSTRTIERHINQLFEAKLLDEVVYVDQSEGKNGEVREHEYSCYLFPYDENGTYKIVDRDFIKYLVDTRNAHCIRIYLYLLNKYEWKSDYSFSLVELQKAIGYSENTKAATDTVKNIIESMAREGIIRYEEEYDYIEKNGEIHKVPRKILKFVARSTSQLRQPV